MTAIVIQRYDRVRIADLAMADAALAPAKAAEAAMHAASGTPSSAMSAVQSAVEAAEASASVQSLSACAKTTATYRVHQEDFCQALRVHPALKYQNDGGPGPKQIVDLLRANASGAQRSSRRGDATTYEEDVATFLDALILNWLIGGTDAHAKNYSILIGGGGLVRLAPMYDVGLPQWRTLAADVRVDADALVDRVRAMAGALPDCLSDETGKLRAAGFEHRVIDALAKVLPVRAARIARA